MGIRWIVVKDEDIIVKARDAFEDAVRQTVAILEELSALSEKSFGMSLFVNVLRKVLYPAGTFILYLPSDALEKVRNAEISTAEELCGKAIREVMVSKYTVTSLDVTTLSSAGAFVADMCGNIVRRLNVEIAPEPTICVIPYGVANVLPYPLTYTVTFVCYCEDPRATASLAVALVDALLRARRMMLPLAQGTAPSEIWEKVVLRAVMEAPREIWSTTFISSANVGTRLPLPETKEDIISYVPSNRLLALAKKVLLALVELVC